MNSLSLLKPALGAIAIALACAIVAAGCGGGSSSDPQTPTGNSGSETTASSETTSESTLTKREFIAKADAICTKAGERIESEFAAYLKSKGIKEIGEKGESAAETEAREVEVIETLGIPSLTRQREEIVALGLPKEDEEQVETYLDAVQEGIEDGEQNPALLYNSAQKVFAKSDKIAGEIGLKVCGNR